VDIPKTRWAETIDGAQIAYQDFGEGPLTLVIIHGWVSHLEVYWEQPRYARFMRRLAARMRVLNFDKRGVGMSDRFERPPDLETRMDDIRAVMDAAGVERAALLGYNSGGPQMASFFAASHPERTVALCIDPAIRDRWAPDYPWGQRDEEFERQLAEEMAIWGEAGRVLGMAHPPEDVEFIRWDEKISRFAATPRSMAAFSRMWFETDVRDILPTIRVPTIVLYKTEGAWFGAEPAAYVASRIAGARAVGVPGREWTLWFEDPEPLVAAIEAFLASVHKEEAELDRVLATVLFTDIVGSTGRAAKLGDTAWKALLERHHAIVRAMIGRYRGTEIDTAGDGFLATFDGPARGVRCAQAIAEAMGPLGLEIRAGLHTGEVETIDGKVGGIAVHIGGRVGALAGTSEVWVSSTVKDLVAGSGLTFEDAGEHELKGVPDRWHLYRVLK
jgi:class 3 adenylate cyclase